MVVGMKPVNISVISYHRRMTTAKQKSHILFRYNLSSFFSILYYRINAFVVSYYDARDIFYSFHKTE